ncbi:MAG: aldehyde dehydrogenase family protein [Terriglobales bacterium]
MLDQAMVAEITREVVARIRTQLQVPAVVPAPRVVPASDGVFATVEDAVAATASAQKQVGAMSLEERGRMIAIIRRICSDNAAELGRMELDETRVGRLDHKIEKLRAVRNVLGIEAMRTEARSDRSGLCVTEHAPWGVVGMALPVTHSVPTMASNAINVIAAGNTAVFAPHPSGAKVAQYALQLFNRQIAREIGIANVLTTVREPGIEVAEQIFKHPGVALLCVTGGPAVVQAAGRHGKRVIAAGPGNPPVVVDETADLNAAAKAIIEGAAFDNNLLCIGEKEVFVVASVADAFVAAMRRAGAFELDRAAIERLSRAAFTFDGHGTGCSRAHLKKDLVGKDAALLATAAGMEVPAGTELLFGETDENHPFVQEEQMMPFIPMVRVRDFDAAIQAALKAEHDYRHTAIIHSRNVEHVTRMARAMNTTLFVHNAPSMAALGSNGPGYLSFSIATPTGEGITTPLTFTRERQITIGQALRIT